jgi:hypothetical protein
MMEQWLRKLLLDEKVPDTMIRSHRDNKLLFFFDKDVHLVIVNYKFEIVDKIEYKCLNVHIYLSPDIDMTVDKIEDDFAKTPRFSKLAKAIEVFEHVSHMDVSDMHFRELVYHQQCKYLCWNLTIDKYFSIARINEFCSSLPDNTLLFEEFRRHIPLSKYIAHIERLDREHYLAAYDPSVFDVIDFNKLK